MIPDVVTRYIAEARLKLNNVGCESSSYLENVQHAANADCPLRSCGCVSHRALHALHHTQDGLNIEHAIRITDKWRSDWQRPLQGQHTYMLDWVLGSVALLVSHRQSRG